VEGLDARRLARTMPIAFARHVKPDFEVTPIAELENNLFLDIAAGTVDRSVVVGPPQHGKTTLAQYALAWLLGIRPEMRIMAGSYALDLAKQTGREARDLLEEHGPELFGVGIRPEVTKSSDWQTTHGGGLFSGGRQGGFTGRGAHFAYVDDLFKNIDEAESETVQLEAQRFLDLTITTRLQKGGAILMTNTRWTENDVVGHIRRTQWDRWSKGKGRAYRVPAIADLLDFDGAKPAPDPCGRKLGEPLWPSRFPLALLEDRRATMGPIMFNTVYQGIAAPTTGRLFKRDDFRYWSWADEQRTILRLHRAVGDIDVPYSKCQVAAFMDTAGTEEPSGNDDPDWTVISTWAFTPTGDMVLLDVVRQRVDTTQHETLYDDVHRRWRCMVYVEKGMFGTNLIQGLKRQGRPVAPVSADRNKYSRARALQAKYALHAVYHAEPRMVPEAAVWLPAWEAEVLNFPKGKHDDQVDTGSYAAAFIATWNEPRLRIPGDRGDEPND
jgi:predicted phage terminase large subunit-like protein